MTDANQTNTEEEQELIQIEKMSQQLEQLYKDMEQIRRENLLFESYLLRNQQNQQKLEEAEDKKQKGKKKDKNQDIKKTLLLTDEEKYEIAQFESEQLKKNIDEGRIKSDAILETLRAILEETDMAITEIRKDAFDFQREILIGGENSRTGKIEAERIVKYYEDKLKQKDMLIDKYKAKRMTLESQIWKTNQQIAKKEEMGEDLKFIDFHQLQIENKKYVKEIDEKNQKLLSLKIATGKISQILIVERAKLAKELGYQVNFSDQIEKKTANIQLTEKQRKDLEKKKNQLDIKAKQLTRQAQFVDIQKEQAKQLETMHYVRLKKKEEELLYSIKNLQRKIEIAELKYTKIIGKQR